MESLTPNAKVSSGTPDSKRRWPPKDRYSLAGLLSVAAALLWYVKNRMANPHTIPVTSYIIIATLILLALALVPETRLRSYTSVVFVGAAFGIAASTFNSLASPWFWKDWGGLKASDYFYLVGAVLLAAAVALVISVQIPSGPTIYGRTPTRLIFTAAVVLLVVVGPYNNVYGLPQGSPKFGQLGQPLPLFTSLLGLSMATVLVLFLGVYALQHVADRSSRRSRASLLGLVVAVVLAPVVVYFLICPPSSATHLDGLIKLWRKPGNALRNLGVRPARRYVVHSRSWVHLQFFTFPIWRHHDCSVGGWRGPTGVRRLCDLRISLLRGTGDRGDCDGRARGHPPGSSKPAYGEHSHLLVPAGSPRPSSPAPVRGRVGERVRTPEVLVGSGENSRGDQERSGCSITQGVDEGRSLLRVARVPCSGRRDHSLCKISCIPATISPAPMLNRKPA